MATTGSSRYRLTLPRYKYEIVDNKYQITEKYQEGPGYNMAIEVKGRESAIKMLIHALKKAGMIGMRVQRGYYLWKDK